MVIGGSPWRTIEQRTREAEGGDSDVDAVVEEYLVTPERVPSPLSMDDLDRVIGAPDLMPPGVNVQPLGRREYGFLASGATDRIRVTSALADSKNKRPIRVEGREPDPAQAIG